MIVILFLFVGIVSGIFVATALTMVGLADRRWPYALVIVLGGLAYPLVQSLGSSTEFWGSTWYISIAMFSIIALLGLFRSPWWIAAGLILHGLFDLAIGSAGSAAAVGPFYSPWCAGLDFTLGLIFVFRVCITPEPRYST